jgi:arginase
MNTPEKTAAPHPLGNIRVLGIPFDEHESFLRGPAQAPASIRAALHEGSMNLWTENGIDLEASAQWQDGGDVDLSAGDDPFARITATVAAALEQGERVLSLGGDHSVTYPILRAYGQRYKPLTILHLDAHPDLYEEFEGNRLSHACPFARIMEGGLATRLVQVGIRTMNQHQREQAQRYGVEVIEMRQWASHPPLALDGPLYISLDIDVLDPACAPGISHYEPGGFTTRELIGILQGITVPVVGADLVEINPVRDPQRITAMTGAKLLKELLALMLTNR